MVLRDFKRHEKSFFFGFDIFVTVWRKNPREFGLKRLRTNLALQIRVL